MPDKSSGPLRPTETIECPLCSGAGALTRAEILDRLGVKDFARVAQLSAEEAFRLLQNKHDHQHQSAWARFETELSKRTAEIRERHKDELRTAQSERDAVTRRVEDCLREVAQLQEKNQQLEAELSKVARIGKREEMDFADEARSWAGISVSEKLPKNGDFILAYRDPSGTPLEPYFRGRTRDQYSVNATSSVFRNHSATSFAWKGPSSRSRSPLSNSVISPAVLGLLILFNARKMCSLRRRLEFGIFFIAGSTVSNNRPS